MKTLGLIGLWIIMFPGLVMSQILPFHTTVMKVEGLSIQEERNALYSLFAKCTTMVAAISEERKFLMAELSMHDAGIVFPLSNSSVGMMLSQFGKMPGAQTSAALFYRRHIGNTVVGTRFGFTRMKMEGRLSRIVTSELAASTKIDEGLQVAILLRMPAALDGLSTRERTEFGCGLGYDLSKLFYGGLWIEKEANGPIHLEWGILYHFLRSMRVRIGGDAGSSSLYVGSGYRWGVMGIDFIVNLHPSLGVSPQLILSWVPVKEKP